MRGASERLPGPNKPTCGATLIVATQTMGAIDKLGPARPGRARPREFWFFVSNIRLKQTTEYSGGIYSTFSESDDRDAKEQ